MEHIKPRDYYDTIIKKEISYIKTLTLDCGAIGMYAPEVNNYAGLDFKTVNGISPDEYLSWPSVRVVPYFSDAAVLGIIKCAEMTGNDDGKDIALGFINWYIDHMNTTESDLSGVKGTVYDYYIFQSNDGRTVEVTQHDAYAVKYPTGNPYDYDSTDSYAAMFIQLLYEYSNVFDNSFLDGKREIVDTLIDVIFSTYIKNLDLTIAKPTYPECYLMDNCEVYCGFVSAAGIYKDYYNDGERAEFCLEYAEKVKTAVLKRLWDEKSQCFKAAISDRGVDGYANDLSIFYPQATCQLFPIMFGLLEPEDERAVKVYERFKADFCRDGVDGKDWSAFNVEGVTFPWCTLLNAVVRMSDYELAEKFIDVMNRRFVIFRHPKPFYNSESGCLLQAIAMIYPLAVGEEESVCESSTEEASEDISSESETIEASLPVDTVEKKPFPWLFAGIAAAVCALGAVAAIIIKKSSKK